MSAQSIAVTSLGGRAGRVGVVAAVALGLGACAAVRAFGPASLPTPIVSPLAVSVTAVAVIAVAVISAVRVKRIDVALALRSD